MYSEKRDLLILKTALLAFKGFVFTYNILSQYRPYQSQQRDFSIACKLKTIISFQKIYIV
jgi:hypothetical protein